MNLKDYVLGLELGSTRIKAVLIDRNYAPVVTGSYEWANTLQNGIWTYSYDDIVRGVQTCFAVLKKNAEEKLGVPFTTVGAIGISGMMHGYLPLDKDWQPLTEFRTWRNRITRDAADTLTRTFNFNIPQRWSIAHLFHAIFQQEDHLKSLSAITTLSGYITGILCGKNVLGIGEASGVFPIDSHVLDYNGEMLAKADALIPTVYTWSLRDILPEVAVAGQKIGTLTQQGAFFLDPTGCFMPDIPICAPEGDAGTGMVATNAVRPLSGNVSAGTSAFAMIVTDKPLSMHREIDMATTPAGAPVAMVQANNCTSDINAWTDILYEFAGLFGVQTEKSITFEKLFQAALEGDADCGGIVSYNYFSGEAVANLSEGRPMLIRTPEAKFTLANFMRANLYSALTPMKIGMDILCEKENVKIKSINAHGGFFKAPRVGQYILSSTINAPVSVMKTSCEGGPYGMALLASFMLWKEKDEKLEDYLDNKVFKSAETVTVMADKIDVEGFQAYVERYQNVLPVEALAVDLLR